MIEKVLLFSTILYIIYNEYRTRKINKKTKGDIKNQHRIIENFKVEVKQMINTTIRIRRGNYINLPAVNGEEGEPFIAVDNGVLAIARGKNKVKAYFKPVNFEDIIAEKYSDTNSNFKPLIIDLENNKIE